MPDSPLQTPPATPPAAPADDPVARLQAVIESAMNNAAKRAVAEVRTPTPPSAPAPSPAEEETAEKWERLIMDGKPKEALKLIKDAAFAPLAAQQQQLAEAQAESNLDRMREKLGDRFKKREELFRSVQRKHGVSDAYLANPRIVEQIWNVVKADDPTWVDEEVERRMEGAKKEFDTKLAEAQAAVTTTLSPVAPPVKVKDEFKTLADKYLPHDSRDRAWMMAQCEIYQISLEGYLSQRAKEDDPSGGVYVGPPSQRKRIATYI